MHAIYRACFWLPIVVPVLLIAVVNAFGLGSEVGLVGEALAYSLLWGGLPYVVLGAWATWWIGGREEYSYVAVTMAVREWLGPESGA